MCDYPDCNKPGEYLLGVSKAKSKKAEKIIGTICTEDMRNSINTIMSQCFGSKLWVTIYDLDKNLLYHSFDADLEGYSAAAGWEVFLSENSKNDNEKQKDIK